MVDGDGDTYGISNEYGYEVFLGVIMIIKVANNGDNDCRYKIIPLTLLMIIWWWCL